MKYTPGKGGLGSFLYVWLIWKYFYSWPALFHRTKLSCSVKELLIFEDQPSHKFPIEKYIRHLVKIWCFWFIFFCFFQNLLKTCWNRRGLWLLTKVGDFIGEFKNLRNLVKFWQFFTNAWFCPNHALIFCYSKF